MKKLKCDMREECNIVVTHIDIKGFIYCKGHGEQRKISHRCRQLTVKELKILKSGKPIKEY